MNLQGRPREEPEVNLTSLIDVVLLLLVFFMVSTSFVREADLQVNAIRKTVGDDRALPVVLRADGRASHQSVVTAMDVLGKMGFDRISIATVNEQDGS